MFNMMNAIAADAGSLESMQNVGDNVDEEETCTELAPELEGLIRSHLPITACIKFASVCKSWYSTIASPAFTVELSHRKQGKSPFFLLWGIRPSSSHSLYYLYDPIYGRWSRILTAAKPPLAESGHYSLIGGAHSTLILYSYVLTMPRSFKLYYAPNPTCTEWRLIPPSRSPFTRSPILCSFPCEDGFKIFLLNTPRFVMLYDSATNRWEHCPELPSRNFYSSIGSYNMSCAVVCNKIYIANISSGMITSFDINLQEWSELSMLRILSAVYMLIVSSDMGLFVVALCDAQGGRCLKLFKINELSMDCDEVSTMPHDLWHVFEDKPELHSTRLMCVGSGELMYVYYGSMFNDIRICACNLENYRWWRLPDLPSDLRESDIQAGSCSLQLMPATCLRLQIPYK